MLCKYASRIIVRKCTGKQKSELKKLASMPDEDIDTSDIPETTDWSNAVVGKYYRPLKQQTHHMGSRRTLK